MIVAHASGTPAGIPDSTINHRIEVGTAPAPIHDAGMTPTTCSVTQAISSASLPSSLTIIPPSTEETLNRSDHGIIRSSPQQRSIQEPNPCAEYVVPSKGPMSGGIEVTIVGTNFPHTLPLSVYFSTKLALIVSWQYLGRGQPIHAERPPDSEDSRDHKMFCSRRTIPWNC